MVRVYDFILQKYCTVLGILCIPHRYSAIPLYKLLLENVTAILQKWVPYSQRYLLTLSLTLTITLTLLTLTVTVRVTLTLPILLTLILDTVVNKAPTSAH